MKKGFLILTILLVLSSLSFAQNNFDKTYKGDYIATTLFTGNDVSAGDTSETWYVPSDVNAIIYFIETDTITSGDAVTNIVVDYSFNNVDYVDTDTLSASISAAGVTRVIVTNRPGAYLRVHFSITGSSVKNDFKVWAVPKRY